MMKTFHFSSRLASCVVALLLMLVATNSVYAQRGVSTLRISSKTSSIVIHSGNHYLLEFDYRIPDLWLGDRDILNALPIGPNKIMITGYDPGVTTLTISDERGQMHALTIHCLNDVRDVQNALDLRFPGKLIKAQPLNEGVILRGVVSSDQEFHQANEIATKYYDSVLNHLEVDGAQMVAISVKVYEVSRTKLREVGVDWSYLGTDFSAIQSVSGLIQEVSATSSSGTGQTLSFGVLNDTDRFNAFINILEQRNLAKLLDEPTLVAENGRAAEFLSGGEIPVQISNNFGASSIEFRSFGTKLDIIPIIHGQGLLTLEVKAEVSDVAGDLAVGGTPGFRVRRVNTGVRMKSGQTLALAGDYREETETVVRGIPGLMDAPFLGPLFRDTRERTNETELVFLITPKFVEGTEAGPARMPGRTTKTPTDFELYRHGTLEVTDHTVSPTTLDTQYRGVATTEAPSWGHVSGYADGNQTIQSYDNQTAPSQSPYEIQSETYPTNIGQTYQPGYGQSNPAPPKSFSDTSLRPIPTSSTTSPTDLGGELPPQVQVPLQTPPAIQQPPVQQQPPVKIEPTKKLKLSNPFENRAVTPIDIEGPYGFSK